MAGSSFSGNSSCLDIFSSSNILLRCCCITYTSMPISKWTGFDLALGREGLKECKSYLHLFSPLLQSSSFEIRSSRVRKLNGSDLGRSTVKYWLLILYLKLLCCGEKLGFHSIHSQAVTDINKTSL